MSVKGPFNLALYTVIEYVHFFLCVWKECNNIVFE